VARYETEDGEPRYGKRLSPEELEAYLYEQRVQSPAEPPPNSDWSSESRASSYGASADEAREGRKKEGRENKEGSESDPFVRASGGSAVRLADPLPPRAPAAGKKRRILRSRRIVAAKNIRLDNYLHGPIPSL